MSWQRVLEFARRRGLPLIVTDPAGRDPLVILSLEEYERFLADSTPGPSHSVADVPVRIAQKVKFEPEVFSSSTPEQPVSEIMSLQELESSASASDTPEISLEERFYLEPIGDEQI